MIKLVEKKKTTTIMISDSTPIDRSLSKQLVLMLPYIAAESDIELASAYIIVWAMIKVYEWVLRNCDRWSRFISVIILNLSRFYRPYWRHLPSINAVKFPKRCGYRRVARFIVYTPFEARQSKIKFGRLLMVGRDLFWALQTLKVFLSLINLKTIINYQ